MYKRKRKHGPQAMRDIGAVASGASAVGQGPPRPDEPRVAIAAEVGANRDAIINVLGNPPDLALREFSFGIDQPVHCLVAYIDGLTDPVAVADHLIEPLMMAPRLAVRDTAVTRSNAMDMISERLASVWHLLVETDLGKAVKAMLEGVCLVFVDGCDRCLEVGRKEPPKRQITTTETEQVIRGPREGFTETLRDCTGLVRKRLATPALRFETLSIGRLSNTAVSIVWLQGVANDKIVAEVRRRLQRIDIDGIMDGAYIEELIEDQPYSPFSTVYHTERPDAFCAHLLEGRVGILVDGSSQALVVPATMVMFFQTSEDYYTRFHLTILIRFIRLMASFNSLLLPPVYIAATTFHHNLIPTAFLLSIAAGRESVPFPAVVEALFMVFTFEAVREAGIRLPGIIGQTVSIVGALVIGQAVVSAGVVSPIMVIIIALTEVGSFAVPAYDMAATLRLLRYPLMLLAATLGMFGIAVGLLALLIHLCCLRSFGVPYLSGLTPLTARSAKDIFIRAPWPQMKFRPRPTAQKHAERQSQRSGPQRPKRGERT